MAEVYVVEEVREDRGFVVGWSILDSRDGSIIKIVDMESRRYNDAQLVFNDREHAADFAASLNIGCGARYPAGEKEGG